MRLWLWRTRCERAPRHSSSALADDAQIIACTVISWNFTDFGRVDGAAQFDSAQSDWGLFTQVAKPWTVSSILSVSSWS